MSSSYKTQPVGFLGLGIMGNGMAARLVSESVAGTADRPLYVWNRSAEKCDTLKAKFPDANIVKVGTAKEVVASCGVTYSMLSTPEAAAAVFNASEGTLAGVSDGKAIVDCATLAEADHQGMSEAVNGKGGIYLEAPVSGSKGPAENGSLIFLCGGSKDLFDSIENDGLNVMGKASHFLGAEVGVGTQAKLVVNSVMGTMLSAFSEGIALSQALGLDGSKMVEVFGQGACAAPMFGLKGNKIVKEVADHATNFPLKHAHKDMLLAKDLAAKTGVEYKTNNMAESIFKRARESDLQLADLDFSAVFEQIHEDSKGSCDYSAKRQKK
ncbi:hypothetical protein TrVE_jg3763 [Triparma verrucosa]|uniref:3-hydroxyisobutyrate dehydrogenase n=2 Tax=Triparma TaxID=722752 RepID=A0A9W7EYS6_9STRA|nr:hypothetical protein TrVE_jg3763 [Triparma verrucosa]GMH94738.1 hypothetical protein TrST_g3357 [Triparma strigata]